MLLSGLVEPEHNPLQQRVVNGQEVRQCGHTVHVCAKVFNTTFEQIDDFWGGRGIDVL